MPADKGRGRGLGPFTGRQLTTIICVVTVMALFPVGAWAVTGSNSFITDATSGAHATVSSAGQLSVKTANGSVNKLEGSTSANKVEVTPDQQLLTTEANPSNYYTAYNFATSGETEPLLVSVPAGDAVIVKEVQISTYDTSDSVPFFVLGLSTTNCVSITETIATDIVAAGANSVTTVPFDPGLAVPAGDQLCIVLSFVNDESLVTGYTLPAGAVAGSVHGSPLRAGAIAEPRATR